MRGVRFNFVKRLVDALPFDSLEEIAARVAKLGWHIVIYFEAEDLKEYFNFFKSLPTTVVIDHMGRPDVSKDAYGKDFDLFVKLMENENFWCKTTCPERLSKIGPPAYEDVIPFAKRIVETFEDRVIWGTDWPHPNMKSHMPDDGKLVDFIPKIATTKELQQKLLVTNPMRLYWPEET
jgi:2-pyrone-4,6-dicarboxylate lactonase